LREHRALKSLRETISCARGAGDGAPAAVPECGPLAPGAEPAADALGVIAQSVIGRASNTACRKAQSITTSLKAHLSPSPTARPAVRRGPVGQQQRPCTPYATNKSKPSRLRGSRLSSARQLHLSRQTVRHILPASTFRNERFAHLAVQYYETLCQVSPKHWDAVAVHGSEQLCERLKCRAISSIRPVVRSGRLRRNHSAPPVSAKMPASTTAGRYVTPVLQLGCIPSLPAAVRRLVWILLRPEATLDETDLAQHLRRTGY